MIPREQILAAHPIDAFLEKQGIDLGKSGAGKKACCPFHDDHDPSMSVNIEKGVWYCHVCQFGGTVVDFLVRRDGLSVRDALGQLAEGAGLQDSDQPERVARYQYRDAYGRHVMDVDRIEQGPKKRFIQSRIDASGERVNNVDGVERVLFRLERWGGKEEVALVEGEKCVAALESLDYDATCNPGGSGAWLDAYAQYLRGKHVDIWPDNDEPGEKWLAAVLDSLAGKVATLRILRVPPEYNDVADVVVSQGAEYGAETITRIMADTPRIPRGVIMPLLSSTEVYDRYRARVTAGDEDGIDFGRWLPSFRRYSRTLMAGDMGLILSDTGVGKTTMLLNLAQSQRPLTTIFFQLELAPEPMCERFIALTHGVETLNVERETRHGADYSVGEWDHVYICPDSKLTVEGMEELVVRSELKTGEKPRLVLVDYIGLVGGSGKRYERMSEAAEGLKQMARRTETVVVVASQLRRDDTRQEVGLHDAKDSGSIENSAQLVIGAWRPATDRIMLRILKQTKRAGQCTIEALFDGDRQRIREVTDDTHQRADS